MFLLSILLVGVSSYLLLLPTSLYGSYPYHTILYHTIPYSNCTLPSQLIIPYHIPTPYRVFPYRRPALHKVWYSYFFSLVFYLVWHIENLGGSTLAEHPVVWHTPLLHMIPHHTIAAPHGPCNWVVCSTLLAIYGHVAGIAWYSSLLVAIYGHVTGIPWKPYVAYTTEAGIPNMFHVTY